MDESKANGYYVADTAVVAGEVTAINEASGQLTPAGQDRVHLEKDSDSSRRTL